MFYDSVHGKIGSDYEKFWSSLMLQMSSLPGLNPWQLR